MQSSVAFQGLPSPFIFPQVLTFSTFSSRFLFLLHLVTCIVFSMVDTPDTKESPMHHVEETHKGAPLEDVIRQREQHDAEELQEKFHIPI